MESKERDILVVMRRVLTSVIRDITPAPGQPMPLSEQTTQDVRECLKLIAVRERELADATGAVVEKPYYVDQPPETKVVPVASIGKDMSSSQKDDD
jgi:hypothetical protein